MKPSVNIIGAGRLGKTIGSLLIHHDVVNIIGICNQSKQSSMEAIEFIGQGSYYPNISLLPKANLTFITSPDDCIKQICEELIKNQYIDNESIIIHCSGHLSSDVLIAAKSKKAYIASVHPMRSFANPKLSVEQYKGTYCAIEGDKEILPQIHKLFSEIGSVTYEINKDHKTLYHAAGVFASNYLVTLANTALTCMQQAGLQKEVAMQIITNIMFGTVTNLRQTLSPEQSLTGPIKRADLNTIKEHISSLSQIELQDLYAILGQETIGLTTHNKDIKNRLRSLLDSDK